MVTKGKREQFETEGYFLFRNILEQFCICKSKDIILSSAMQMNKTEENIIKLKFRRNLICQLNCELSYLLSLHYDIHALSILRTKSRLSPFVVYFCEYLTA